VVSISYAQNIRLEGVQDKAKLSLEMANVAVNQKL
jgi:hypothetical protein